MERKLSITLPDGIKMNAKLRGQVKKNTPVVLWVHGLGSNMEHHLFFNGARFLEKRGIPSLRMNLYGGGKQMRHMRDATLDVQAEDIVCAAKYLSKLGPTKIWAIGHGFGALALLLTKNKSLFSGFVLLEPAYDPFNFEYRGLKYIKAVDGYVYQYAFDVIIGPKLVKEAEKLDCITLGRDISVPIMAVSPGQGRINMGATLYLQNAQGPKKLVVMPGVSHGFSDDGAEEKLFKLITDYIKKSA